MCDCKTRRRSFFVARPAFGDEPVADPWLGLDVLAAGFAFELLAQLAHEDAQILRLMRRLRAPHRGEQRAMRHHLAGVAGQVQQQIEFLGSQVDRLALNRNGVGR